MGVAREVQAVRTRRERRGCGGGREGQDEDGGVAGRGCEEEDGEKEKGGRDHQRGGGGGEGEGRGREAFIATVAEGGSEMLGGGERYRESEEWMAREEMHLKRRQADKLAVRTIGRAKGASWLEFN